MSGLPLSQFPQAMPPATDDRGYAAIGLYSPKGDFFIPFVCVDCETEAQPPRYQRAPYQRRPICTDCIEANTTMFTGYNEVRNYGGWDVPGASKGDKAALRRIAALINAIKFEPYRAKYR